MLKNAYNDKFRGFEDACNTGFNFVDLFLN